MLEKAKKLLEELTQKEKKLLATGALALATALILLVVQAPAFIAASNDRELPIYSVERDQKMVALSFDAAWGDAILRPARSPAAAFLQVRPERIQL